MTLNDVVVGDSIIVHGRHGAANLLFKVERITSTQVVCDGGTRFMRTSGRMIGHRGYYPVYGFKATDETIERVSLELRISRAKKALRELNVDATNLDKVEAMIDAISAKES
jgi:hypothetical protein